MADGINLPGGLYTAGAVPIDTSPAVSFAANLLARKQARDDSLNEYYQNQHKELNPDGVRPADMPDYLSKVNAWQDHYAENKENILHPGNDKGVALNENNARYNDAMAFIQSSKDRQNISDQVLKLRSDPTRSYLFDNDQIIPSLHANNLPINSPGSKPLDINELHMNTQPLDAKTLQAQQAGLMKNIKMVPIGPAQTKSDGNLYIPMGYDKTQKQAYGNAAMTLYGTDRRIQAQADRIVNDPALYTQSYKAFVDAYGRPPQNSAELFAGFHIASNAALNTEGAPLIKPNFAAHQNILQRNRLQMEGVRQGDRKELVDYNHWYKMQDASTQAAANSSHVDNSWKDAQANPIVHPDGTQEFEPKNKDYIILRSLGQGTYSHKVLPDTYTFNSDGSAVRGIFYKKNKHTGQPIMNDDGTPMLDPYYNNNEWYDANSLKTEIGKTIKGLPASLAGTGVNPQVTPPTTKTANVKENAGAFN
jgi:hypothetical protein